MEKKTRGRQKISIEKIEKENECYATFSKRRLGLFRKASELSTLCNVDLGVFIFSPTGKPFSFFHPSMESVISRFRSPDQQPDDTFRLLDAYTRTKVLQLNEMLDKLDQQMDVEKERERLLDDMARGGSELWEEPVQKEHVDQLTELLQNLHSHFTNRQQRRN